MKRRRVKEKEDYRHLGAETKKIQYLSQKTARKNSEDEFFENINLKDCNSLKLIHEYGI